MAFRFYRIMLNISCQSFGVCRVLWHQLKFVRDWQWFCSLGNGSKPPQILTGATSSVFLTTKPISGKHQRCRCPFLEAERENVLTCIWDKVYFLVNSDSYVASNHCRDSPIHQASKHLRQCWFSQVGLFVSINYTWDILSKLKTNLKPADAMLTHFMISPGFCFLN